MKRFTSTFPAFARLVSEKQEHAPIGRLRRQKQESSFRGLWRRFVTGACLAVAGAVASAARPQYGGTLRVDTQTIVRTLDPLAAASDPAASASRNRLRALVFETLVAVDPAGGLQPLLARSWEGDARGTRWRFRLRSGVVLHDGNVLEPWQVATALRARSACWRWSAPAAAAWSDPTVSVLRSRRSA